MNEIQLEKKNIKGEKIIKKKKKKIVDRRKIKIYWFRRQQTNISNYL